MLIPGTSQAHDKVCTWQKAIYFKSTTVQVAPQKNGATSPRVMSYIIYILFGF